MTGHAPGDSSDARWKVLHDAAARYVGSAGASSVIASALRNGGFDALPTDTARARSFIDDHVTPLVVRAMPFASTARRDEARDALHRVAAILGRASESVAAPSTGRRIDEESTTKEIGLRRFDEMFLAGTHPSVEVAFRAFRDLGSRVVPLADVPSVGSELGHSSGGAVLVVVDVRTTRDVWEAVLAHGSPSAQRLTVVVWGDHAETTRARRTFVGATVVHLPPTAGTEQLLTVVRLGPS